MGRFEELGTALDFLFGKILNRNFNKVDELIQKNEQELSAHKLSAEAHDAGSIAYRGAVVGAENTKQAIDNLKGEVNTIVAYAGDGTKDTELILARGNEPTLGDRLDTTDAQLADTMNYVSRKEVDIWDYAHLVADKPTTFPSTWDWTPALHAAADDAVALDGKIRLTFPTGIYNYRESANWGISNLQMIGLGEVVLRNTTATKTFIMDASADGIRRYFENIHMENFIIQGHAGALSGFFRRNIVRSTFKNIEVREVNSSSGKAFHFLWGVSNAHYDLKHSVNSYNTPNAAYDGLFIENTDVGGDKSTNETYTNTVVEGSSIGCRLFVGDNHIFVGGTFERNLLYGVVTGAETRGNKFIGIAMEANGTADISESGKLNHYDCCYTQKNVLIQASSEQAKVSGGFHQAITITAAAKNPIIEDISISQYQAGGSIVHNNNQTARIRNVINWQTGTLIYGQTAMNPVKARTGITVGTSPFTFTNNTQFPMLVNVSGGDIYAIYWGNGGDSFEIAGSTTTGNRNGQFLLLPGDFLRVQYNAAPSMNYIPR